MGLAVQAVLALLFAAAVAGQVAQVVQEVTPR